MRLARDRVERDVSAAFAGKGGKSERGMSADPQAIPRGDSTRPVRVLIVSKLILWRRDEGSEFWEQVSGMVEANTAGAADILVTDCSTVYRPHMDAHQMRFEPIGSIASSWFTGADIVHVLHLLPAVRHLLIAALFRVRGSTIVFSPMAFLTRDFALRSWTHRRPRLWTASKTAALRVLKASWNLLAHTFVCQSLYEVRSSKLPENRCVIVHWPRPDVPLLTESRHLVALKNHDRSAQIAFVSRMDPWRKGLDRLCTWLSEYASSLPHPAVVLLVPRCAGEPPQLEELVRAGLVDWDWKSQGAALENQLRRCRGSVLLSRYDAQPRSLREALWLGLPIICTPECGLDQVVSLLDAGKVVDGGRPAEIQAAFDSLAGKTVNIDDVHRVLDRMETGRFLLSVLVALGTGRQPPRSYYDQQIGTSPNPHLLTLS
jgi:glycosyltransferase involved in cell wall biosynthesis